MTSKAESKQNNLPLQQQQQPLDEITRALLSMSESDDFYIDDNGCYVGREPVNKLLAGEEAMQFLGLPPRQHQLLMRGDVRRIYEKFKPVLERYIKDGEDPKEQFWKHITIKVWKISNIGKQLKVPDETSTKQFSPLAYAGDIFNGRTLEGFLPEEARSTRHSEFKVQLISINATEDMLNHASR